MDIGEIQITATAYILKHLKRKRRNEKQLTVPSAGEIVKTHTLLVGMQNSIATLENSLTVCCQVKHILILWPSSPPSKYKEKWKHMSVQRPVYKCLVALFILAKN